MGGGGGGIMWVATLSISASTQDATVFAVTEQLTKLGVVVLVIGNIKHILLLSNESGLLF